MKAFVIIPAKGDSKRLVGKNKRIIAGKTLLEHSIIYSQKSKLAKTIIVSTEDEKTKSLSELHGVKVVGREKDFMGEREVADVYVKIFQEYGDDSFTHVVGVQPDHPDRTIPLDQMLNYALENKYDIINDYDRVHLLGCNLPQAYLYYKDYPFIETIDTSNPIIHGLEGIRYSEGGLLQKSNQKIDKDFTQEVTLKQKEDILYNVEMFRKINNI